MKNPHSLIFLLFLTMLGALPPLSIDMALPAMRQIGAGLATPPGTIGLTLTLFMVGISATPLLYGPLSDRFGRRPMLLIGIGLFTLGSAAATFAPSIGVLLVARLVQGAGAGAGMSMSFAIVRDLFAGDESRVKLSYIQMIVGVAPLIAPSLGAVILILAGWRAIYGVLLVGGALLLATVVLLPESHARPERPGPIFGQVLAAYRTLLTSRLGFGYALVFALTFGTQFSFIAGSPLVFMGQFRLSALLYGLSFACNAAGMMSGAYVNAWAVRRRVPAGVLLGGSLLASLAAIATMLALAAAGLAGAVSFTALQVVCALCIGISSQIASHETLEALPQIAGTAGAVLTAMRMGAAVLASAIVAASYASYGLYAMLVPMLGFALLTIAIYALVVRPGHALAPAE